MRGDIILGGLILIALLIPCSGYLIACACRRDFPLYLRNLTAAPVLLFMLAMILASTPIESAQKEFWTLTMLLGAFAVPSLVGLLAFRRSSPFLRILSVSAFLFTALSWCIFIGGFREDRRVEQLLREHPELRDRDYDSL